MIKITKTIVIVALAACQCLLAQPKSMLSLTVGPSIPTGQFAQKSPNSVVAFNNAVNNFTSEGFAKIGYNISAGYQYRIKKNWGLTFQFKWQQNAVNSDAVKQYLLQNNTWATTATVNSSAWSAYALMIGGFWNIPLQSRQNKLEIQLKILGGVLKTSIPSKKYFLSNYPSTKIAVSSQDPQSLSLGFSFLGSGGIVYHLNKRFNLLANLAYSDAFLSSPTYLKLTFVNGMLLYTGDPYHVNINVSTIDLNVGVGYKF